MRYAIWYHLHNLKNVRNTPPWMFLRFLNCTNDTKSRNASQIPNQSQNASHMNYLDPLSYPPKSPKSTLLLHIYSTVPDFFQQFFGHNFIDNKFLLPCHTYFSPSDSTAKPKSASLTAAPFSLLANRRFSG